MSVAGLASSSTDQAVDRSCQGGPSIQESLLARGWRFALRTLGASVLIVYLGWNLFWLVQLRVPPSLFQSLTGLPCPTTGCTRSMLALYRGEITESLRYNALTVPICLLLAATLSQLLSQLLARNRLAVSPWLVSLWAIILPLAWLLKLAGDPSYW